MKTESAVPAEIPDEILFKQPESSHLGDCPICFLPLPLAANKSTVLVCCCKRVCYGCAHQNAVREINDKLKQRCPFCRKEVSKSPKDTYKDLMKRAQANDPVAMREVAMKRDHAGDDATALTWYKKAAKSGDAGAHYNLGVMFKDGQGVERNRRMEIYHYQEAAVRGHHMARHNLGCYEGLYGRYDRAVKHFLIGARLGDDNAIQRLKKCYKDGHVSKEEFAAALRAYQAAFEATRSPQRVAVEDYFAKKYSTQWKDIQR